MTEHLSTMLRERVHATEPANTLSPEPAFAAGRRKVRARRVGAGLACTTLLALAGLSLPALTGGGTGAIDVDRGAASSTAPADFDADTFPETIDAAIRGSLGDALPAGVKERVTAHDSQGQTLPKRHWDKASDWTATYAWDDAQWIDTTLAFDGSASEGSARRFCKEELKSGYKLECVVSLGPGGEVLMTSVNALRKAVLAGGEEVWMAVYDVQAAKPDKLYFTREVKARRGGSYVIRAREVVKAATLEEANERFEAPAAALTNVALHPDLVFPEPPTDENGCVWVMPTPGYSCG